MRLRIPPSGQLRVHASDAATGSPVPFRVRVVGAGATEVPDLGPIWSAAGARDVVASAGAPVELPLPLGEYRVIVTRGPEWSLEERPVVVTGARTAELAVALRRVVDPGAWIACDFHLHAAPSPDSHVTLEDRVTALVAEGVRYAVPTDHNHVTDYAPSVEALGVELGTIPGVEVTTWEPAFGHFNAFPFPLDPALPANGAPAFLGLTPAGLFAALRERSPGAIVQVNHPRLEPDIGYFDRTGLDPATGAATGPQRRLRHARGVERLRPRAERQRRAQPRRVDRHARARAPGGRHREQRLAHHPHRVGGLPAHVRLRGRAASRTRARRSPTGASREAARRPTRACPTAGPPLDGEALEAGAAAAGGGAAGGGAIEGGANDGGVTHGSASAIDGGASDGTAIDGGASDGGAIDGGAIDGGAGTAGAGTADAGPPLPRAGDGDWRLVDALREGRVFVTNGPFVDLRVDGRGPGETLSVGRRARVTVEVHAPEWIDVSSIDLYVGPRIERTIAIRPRRARRGDPPSLRARERVELRVSEPTFVLAVVRGEATMDVLFARGRVRPLAFTNPVWLAPR
ncbi:MAG: hypothetical protein M5U28_03430 [Sandaracinaceae bacterium]|nr:hypothetical protein [Sandaracinaceae bacterium]